MITLAASDSADSLRNVTAGEAYTSSPTSARQTSWNAQPPLPPLLLLRLSESRSTVPLLLPTKMESHAAAHGLDLTSAPVACVASGAPESASRAHTSPSSVPSSSTLAVGSCSSAAIVQIMVGPA
jgi:hypothetical protein